MSAATKATQSDFGKMPDGTAIQLFTLTNQNGIQARITNYGGIVVSLTAPDRKGAMADVVLGFDSLAGYLANPGPHFGALIGRYGNRIGLIRCTAEPRASTNASGPRAHCPMAGWP
jgi:aldose 1-epimerase